MAGIGALDAQEDTGLAEEIARAELDMRDVQLEEDRVIRLFQVDPIIRTAVRLK